MRKFYTIIIITNIILINLILTSCASSNKAPGRQLYTAHNLWYDNSKIINGINFKAGAIIPCGTPVELVGYERGTQSYFTVKFTRTGKELKIQFYRKYFPGWTVDQLAHTIVTTKSFDENSDGLSLQEIQAIRDAKVIKGMTKKAVLLCLGYPPAHQTESLSINIWRYWINQRDSFLVEFDENGKVKDDVNWQQF